MEGDHVGPCSEGLAKNKGTLVDSVWCFRNHRFYVLIIQRQRCTVSGGGSVAQGA